MGILGICLAGCTEVVPPDGLLCEPGDRCPAGQSCIEGVCSYADSLQENPLVESISPAPASAGVSEAEPVVIRFQKTMVPDLTAAAVTIEPAAMLTELAWNEDNTELTLHYRLEAGEEPYPAVPVGVLYTVTIDGAQAVDGTVLDQPLRSTFTTETFQVHELKTISSLSGHTTVPFTTGYTYIGGGDYSGGRWRGYVTFDLSGFPRELESEIDRAQIVAHLYQINGSPFSHFGDLMVEHSLFGSRTEAALAPATSEASVLIPATPAPRLTETYAVDVTAAAIADVGAREDLGDRSHFLLRYSSLPEELVSGTHTAWLINSAAQSESRGKPATFLEVRTRY